MYSHVLYFMMSGVCLSLIILGIQIWCSRNDWKKSTKSVNNTEKRLNDNSSIDSLSLSYAYVNKPS